MAIPIQDQVANLEQSKRLKELGVNVESEFAFVERLDKMELTHVGEFNRWAFQYSEPMAHERVNLPAYTVAELGVAIGSGYYTFQSDLHKGNWAVSTIDDVLVWSFGKEGKPIIFPTEAQARAQLLIHLIESGELKIEEVNKRLNK